MIQAKAVLTAQELLSGSALIHDIQVPPQVLTPGQPQNGPTVLVDAAYVRMRPLNVMTLTLISRAAREDASLVPVLMIKESLVEPTLTLDQIRQLHVGLVHFLVSQVNLISGLGITGDALNRAVNSADGTAYVMLAKHFGWTPEQVGQLTPSQIAIYLAGVERLLEMENKPR